MFSGLPVRLWVEALIRRAEINGASAFVVQPGDDERGDVLIKVARLDGTAAAYVPAPGFGETPRFSCLTAQGIGPEETLVDRYVTRARQRDRDLWIIEIEDREGRHFLSEEVVL